MPDDFFTDPRAAAMDRARADLSQARERAVQSYSERSQPPDLASAFDQVGAEHRVPASTLIALAISNPDDAPEIALQRATRRATALRRAMDEGATFDEALGKLTGNPQGVGALRAISRDIERQLRGSAPEEAAPAEPASEDGGRLSSAFRQGNAAAVVRGHEFAATLNEALEAGPVGSFLNAAASWLGIERNPEPVDPDTNPFYRQAQQTLSEIQETGYEIKDWRDIRGLKSLVQFVGENVAQSLPQMAAMMTTGGFSPVVGITLLGGEVDQELRERTDLDAEQRALVASGTGVLMWGLDAIGLGSVLGMVSPSEIAKRALKGELSDQLASAGVKRATARVLEAAVVEGSTEAMQEGLVLAASELSGGEYAREEVLSRLSDAFAGGAAAGGGIRTAAEAVQTPVEVLRDGAGEGRESSASIEDTNSSSPIAEPVIPPEGAGPATDAVTTARSDAPIGPAESAIQDVPTPAVEEETTALAMPMYPDLKPGTPLSLDYADPDPVEAVYLGEEGGQPMVRVQGATEPVPVDHEVFQAAVRAISATGLEGATPAPDSETEVVPFPDPAPVSSELEDTVEPSREETGTLVAAGIPRAGEPEIIPPEATPSRLGTDLAEWDDDAGVYTRPGGRPFKNRRSAHHAARSLDLKRGEYDVSEVDGGYHLVENAIEPSDGAVVADDVAAEPADVQSPDATTAEPIADSADPSLESGPRSDADASAERGASSSTRAPTPIAQAAALADPTPTDAQKEVGNYRKGHARWNGLNLTIENAKGSTRSGTAPDGSTWSVEMPANYGYIKRTEGADGDHVDFYMGPAEDSDLVVIVDQKDAETGEFDEHKIMLGFKSKRAALMAYRRGFSDGRANERLGGSTVMTVSEFKTWLEGDTTTPAEDTAVPTSEEINAIFDEEMEGGEASSPAPPSAAVATPELSNSAPDPPAQDGRDVKEDVSQSLEDETPSPVRDAARLRKDLEGRLQSLGLNDAVSVRVASDLTGRGPDGRLQSIEGRATGRLIEVASSDADPYGAFDHEIIHVLRDPSIWDREFGLFTRDEWRALIRAARADRALMSRIKSTYPDLTAAQRAEEAVAEQFASWAAGRRPSSPVGSVFARIKSLVDEIGKAVGGARRNSSFLFDAIEDGSVAARAADQTTEPVVQVERQRRVMKRDLLSSSAHWIRTASEYASSLVTDAMGARSEIVNTLALVPGRPLFTELAKHLPGSSDYLRHKVDMDALRNEWHATTDEVSQRWLSAMKSDPASNEAMMDLMHDATIEGLDPTRLLEDQVKRPSEFDRDRYSALVERYSKLPGENQELFVSVRDTYEKLADDFEAAILENIEKAQEVALRQAEADHERAMQRLVDEHLSPAERDQVRRDADKKLADAKARKARAGGALTRKLRAEFESNRLQGPYFPLARFGRYFATLRDPVTGVVESFSRFETEAERRAFVEEIEADAEYTVETGILGAQDDLSKHVDPGFVASMVEMLETKGDVQLELLDDVWQRWLETLPDQSMRKGRIHRKNRRGYAKDALRAFAHHTFHGGHQLARLQYGMDLELALADMEQEVAETADPVRMRLVLDEIKRRHRFTMNPEGGAVATWITSAAFVYYLGITPAAAVVNLSQTVIVGIPILNAAFPATNMARVGKELTRASADFLRPSLKPHEWGAENSDTLTTDEKAAMVEAYRRGTVDKTQAHDLASVADSGVEYSATRERWMRAIGYFFHHAERANREITYLAAYRLARKEQGLDHDAAIERATDLTWKTHFDYQNTSRPRFMQRDIPKVLFIFRQFTVNMLWRLFRDSREMLHGATEAERIEARRQLTGITMMMGAMAGFTGVWGYGLLTALIGAFMPGGGDEADDMIQQALLIEGEGMGVAAWNYAMGLAIDGIPGRLSNVALSERIGMPDLWFRAPYRELEGEDLYNHHLKEFLGPAFGMLGSAYRGLDQMSQGEWWRGAETIAPKFMTDVMRSVRYGAEGVTTMNGDPILESVSPWHAVVQAAGFTPAAVAERYEQNNLMKRKELRISAERRKIMREAGDIIRSGKPLSPAALEKIYDFNRRFPTWPITGQSLRRSVRGRERASARNEFGIQLNPRLNEIIRGEAAPLRYQ